MGQKLSSVTVHHVPITEIMPNPKNPRKISEDKMQHMMDSLSKFPKMLEYRPILVDRETGYIIGGNQRHTAAKKLGWTQVPVIYLDGVDSSKLRELVLKDNMNFGEWDFDKLRENFSQSDLISWGLEDARYVSFEEDEDEDYEDDEEDTEPGAGGTASEEGYEDNQIRKIVFNFNAEEYDRTLDRLVSYISENELSDNSEALLKLIESDAEAEREDAIAHSFKVAIPSYKRSGTLKDKTLAYLKKCSVPAEDIYIFVANEDEMKDYVSLIGGDYNYVLGRETLRAQRNFIQRYFEEGDFVLNMDDDLEGLYRLDGDGISLETDLGKIATIGYERMKKHGAKIFGVYPVANHFFMKSRVTSDLKYIVGCFWGCIIDHSEELSVTLEDKEDFERTIRYYKEHKSVVRLDGYCVKTNYYKEKGGMQETRTKDRVDTSARYLVEKYPQFCRINTRKKNKEFTEIELRVLK